MATRHIDNKEEAFLEEIGKAMEAFFNDNGDGPK